METDEQRRALMQRVRQRKTAPEEAVAALLRSLGITYRRNVRSLPGSPDFANKSRGWAIFVNGCFWHHHTACGRATLPKNNADFWRAKFAANRSRDARKISELRRTGMRVVVVWECELEDSERLKRRLSDLREANRI
ncbi:very short patch repair endonuclease [Salinarimonas ramus]|uniref:Very short patch repair endonuclease n=1 Tax=Salinarimonas ramus TaxID=690164 RepID=A0A917QCQ5_9HYPH|nr:very short patch repair endonuclease [Salinarimonas ramus]GGK44763.1 very short patch repair endonuclease [Salinarimonas ramus]